MKANKWYIQYLKSSRDLHPEVTDIQYGNIYLKVGPGNFTCFHKGVQTHDPFRTKKARQQYMNQINRAAGEVVVVAAELAAEAQVL